MHELVPSEVLPILRRLEGRGAIETAHRVKQLVGQVMGFAVATSRTQWDPALELPEALKTRRVKRDVSIVPNSFRQRLKSTP